MVVVVVVVIVVTALPMGVGNKVSNEIGRPCSCMTFGGSNSWLSNGAANGRARSGPHRVPCIQARQPSQLASPCLAASKFEPPVYRWSRLSLNIVI